MKVLVGYLWLILLILRIILRLLFYNTKKINAVNEDNWELIKCHEDTNFNFNG